MKIKKKYNNKKINEFEIKDNINKNINYEKIIKEKNELIITYQKKKLKKVIK